MSNQASPGDTNNALLRKILTAIAASVSDGILDANRARPGDTDNKLLQKILTLLNSGTAISEGTVAPVLAAEGPPAVTVPGVEGDVYIDLTNGDVYIFESNTWVLQSSTIGNTWSTSAGVPNDATGRDGDYYLDGVTGILYKKEGPIWVEADVVFEFAPAASNLPYAGTVNLDFASNSYRTVSLTGDIIFTTSNRAAPKAIAVRIIADGSIRNLSFPVGWTWVGSAAPTTIAASKTAILSITCFGANDSDIVAAYAVQS